MWSYIVLLIICIAAMVILALPFHPKIDFVTYGKDGWMILLWYTEYEGHTQHRRCKVLWKHGVK